MRVNGVFTSGCRVKDGLNKSTFDHIVILAQARIQVEQQLENGRWPSPA
jgi:hypothetical protein